MPLLEVKNLHTYFKTKKGIVKAVNDVSYSLEPGKTIGIVGESGSGKSVSAMSILQLLDANGYIAGGEVLFEGKDLTKLSLNEMYQIRGNAISVIFQEPMTSLNPVFTVGKQIMESLIYHQNMTKEQARERAIEMLRLVDIPNPEKCINNYPHNLSGGMRQRVMIAMALACNPKVLIADEPTTALDVTIQAQILKLMAELQKKTETGIILITHDLGIVAQIARNVMVMYAGEAVEYADVRSIFKDPRHPYTIGLLKSIPSIHETQDELYTIKGMVPSPKNLPKGCLFAPRCEYATERCLQERPPLVDIGEGRKLRCWNCTGGEKHA